MRLSRRVRVFLNNDKVVVLAKKPYDFGPGIGVARMQDTIVGGWRSVHFLRQRLAPLDQLRVALSGAYESRY